MTKAERLARQLCKAAADETEARGLPWLFGFMLTTITARAGATDDAAIEAALQVAEANRWAQAMPRGTFMLLEAGRRLNAKKRPP